MIAQVVELRGILSEYESIIKRFENKLNILDDRVLFCMEHNFLEEKRIAELTHSNLLMPILKFRDFHSDLKKCVDSLADTPHDSILMNLIGCEKSRIEYALSISKSRKKARELLNMNERTFFRKLSIYKIDATFILDIQ